MFIQVIRGKVRDAGAARAAMESWQSGIKPKAKGYLGSTSGVADDGTFVAVARFESEDAARANSDSPEQSAWWEQTMSKTLTGTPTFYDCPEVQLFLGGGSDDAGFVQLMIYKASDPDEVRRLADEFDNMKDVRPDLIGGTSAQTADGTFIDTTYFISEQAAREGERKEMPPEVQEQFERFGALTGDVDYIDLRDPWLDSA